MIVYLAGPYRADPHDGIEANIQAARKAAIALWEAGYVVICPHLNTAHFEVDCDVPEETYLLGDLEILRRCDAVVLMLDWYSSRGARIEVVAAEDADIPTLTLADALLSAGGIIAGHEGSRGAA